MNPLFAQIDPDLMKITAGQVAATMLSLTALAGGMMMIAVWVLRRRSGQPVLPQAIRQPLHVPLLLTIAGVVWAGLMAVAVLAVEVAPPADATAGQATTGQARADQAASEDPPDEAAQLPAENTSGDQLSDDDQVTGDAPATDDDGQTASSADGDAAAEGDSSADGDAVTDDSPQSGKSVQQRLSEIGWMMAMNLAFQLATLAAFGVVLYIVQQRRHRGIRGHCDENGGAGAFIESPAPPLVRTSSNLWPDLDEPAAAGAAPIVGNAGDRRNFYTADALATGAAPPFDDSTSANLQGEANPPAVTFERWHFPTELRWAFEVFLVALLPTFLLRLLLVWILDDTAQHPLLELMSEGVPWTIMAMIALMAVVIAPLAEELQYRVIVLGGLAQTGTVLTGWIASSLLFAFAHNFPDSIALLPLAFAIGYAYIRRCSYRTVVLIHFLFNGFNMLLAGLALA